MFTYLSTISYTNLIERHNFTFRICKEVLITNSFVFYFTKNFYLVDEFNQWIDIFYSAGIIEQIAGKYVDKNIIHLMKTTQKNPPSALTYSNVEGFFTIFYCGCFLALISFVFEIFVGCLGERSKAKTKHQRELLVEHVRKKFRRRLGSMDQLSSPSWP